MRAEEHTPWNPCLLLLHSCETAESASEAEEKLKGRFAGPKQSPFPSVVSDTTLAGPLRCKLSHASLRVRLLGESGTAVTGEVGREETEPDSDMERGDEEVSRRHARYVDRIQSR